MSLVLVVIGLFGLVVGGEILVRGAVAIATRLGMSKALIGVTLIGFGTSMPEFVATFGAAAQGSPSIAFGNVMGSNISNILMILGIATLISPIVTRTHGLIRDSVFVSFASLATLHWIMNGGIPVNGGILLLAAFFFYMFLTIKADSKDEIDDSHMEVTAKPFPLPRSIIYAIGGIILLIFSADALIDGASDIARGFGISEAIIGITIVGIGTSLPEGAAAIISSLKGENDLAFANIIGSNIFNGLGILGVTAIFHPLVFEVGGFSILDGGVLVAATAAMFLFALIHKKISRIEGGLFLVAYFSYLIWLVLRAIG